jgi:hypothetical protein
MIRRTLTQISARPPMRWIPAAAISIAVSLSLATSLASAQTPTNSLFDQVKILQAQVATLQSEVSTLQSTAAAQQSYIATLQSDMALLGGQVTADSLVGTYALVGFQNELDPFVPSVSVPTVGSYVYTGTLTLNADGTALATNYAQTGNYLIYDQTLTSADQGPGTGTFNWTYSNGVVTLTLTSGPHTGDKAFFNVGAGGAVMTAAGAKHTDGTSEIGVLLRLQLPLQ